MDKNIVPSLSRSEEVSAFGDMDAVYIDNAVRALKKPGDVVIIEAQHRSLRDHYVKQVLSQLMAVADNVVVNRCKKDRDWMIAAINQAFVKNKVCKKTETSKAIAELWILDLSSSEDFGMLKLAQTLVSQFEEAGVGVLVSCSSSISSQPEFSRWSNRAEIPFWHFEVPDSTAIEAFLERETKSGAVNQARRLVDDLRLSRSEIEEEKLVEDLFALKTEYDENFGAHPLAEQRIKSDGVVVAIKGESPTKIAEPAIQLDMSDFERRKPNRETDSDSSPSSKYTLTKLLRLAAFGTLLIFSSAAAVFVIWGDEVKLDSYEDFLADQSKKILTYFVEQKEGEIVIEPVLAPETKNLDLEAFDDKVIDRSSFDAKSTEIIDLTEDPFTEKEKKMVLSTDSSVVEVTFESDLKASPRPFSQDKIESTEYFAQIAAFSSKNSAFWWKTSKGEEFSDAFIVEKSSGLWAVVTGPYNSKELAKSSMEGRRNDVYVVPGRDIEFN